MLEAYKNIGMTSVYLEQIEEIKDKLSSDNLCSKCSIKIHKRLYDSGINEVVECIECGRESLVNDLDNGLCIYCKCEVLERQIKRLRGKRKAYN